MSALKSVWGIEVGSYAIKAIRLDRSGDEVRVGDFAVIPHRKVLTTPDLQVDEMIRIGLGQLISEKDVRNQPVVMSVPGHLAFARFAKLPPVEPKKIPDIVRFEAVQQIPFPIEDVEWDYQTFGGGDLPELEVGIFAITKERLAHLMGLCGELGIQPQMVNLSPVALFNAARHDLDLENRPGPLVLLDIGTTASDLIVAEQGRAWVRTFPLGGTHFTEAIAESFKVSYSKAEKLKLEASSSKYARQIMQAMRPVFGDLLGDVQKSLSYYQSLNAGVDLTEILGVGSTFRIPGLRKFLGQQLQCEVARLDEFRRISVPGAAGADFAAATVNLGTVYGLALQGLGLGAIDVNLAPVPVLRQQVWGRKNRWFAAAAGVVVAAGGLMFVKGLLERQSLEGGRAETDQVVQTALDKARQDRNALQSIQAESRYGFTAENFRRLVEDREVWPHLIRDVFTSIDAAGPQATLFSGDPEAIAKVPPEDRRWVLLEDLSADYVSQTGSRRLTVSMEVEFSHRGRQDFLNETVCTWLRETAAKDRPEVPYRILAESVSLNIDRLVTETAGKSGTADEATPRSGGESRSRERDRGDDGGFAGASFGSTDGVGGGAMRGRRTGGEKVRAGGAGFAIGGAGAGGGFVPDGQGGEDLGAGLGDRRRDRGGSRREAPAVNADLEKLAPIPVAPSLYAEGQKFHRGVITFEVELVEAETPGLAGEGMDS
ncbi:MAG: pilus assembly protein PilM [Planctomycetota bacterium]|jgi:type IV pilus assembly protein PilM